MSRDSTSSLFVTVFGIWVGGLLALFQLDLWWLWNATFLLWLTSALAAYAILQDAPRQTAVAGWLDSPTYDGLYRRLVTPVANWPRDWRCYDLALRIAVVYPILSMVLLWAMTGKAGTIGTIRFLPAHNSWIVTVVTICSVAMAVSGHSLEKWAEASRATVIRRISNFMRLFAFGVATAGAFAAAKVVAEKGQFDPGAFIAIFATSMAVVSTFVATVAGAFVVAIASLSAIIVTGGFSFVAVITSTFNGKPGLFVAFAIAFAIGYIVLLKIARAMESFVKRGHGDLGYVIFTAVIVLTLLIALFLSTSAETNDAQRSIFLFLGILPVVNALTDYTSYAITIGLVRRGLNTKGWAVMFGLVDLIISFVLFTLLGGLLVFVVAGANALAGVPLFPLGPLFAGLRADPSAYWWLYLMLFSTLVPTLVHLVISVFSMIALPFFALADVPMARWIKNPDSVTVFGPPIVLGLAVTVSVMLPVLMFYCLYLGAAHFWPDIAQSYLAMFEALAIRLGEV